MKGNVIGDTFFFHNTSPAREKIALPDLSIPIQYLSAVYLCKTVGIHYLFGGRASLKTGTKDND